MYESDGEYDHDDETPNRHNVFVIERDDKRCNSKGWTRMCVIKLFEITFIIISLTIMDETYGLNLNNALIIISLLLFFQFCFAIISSIVYATFSNCMCCKCCKHNSVMHSFSYYEYMMNTVCIWYSFQISSLLLLSTILFVSHHPFLMDRFQETFYLFENDITVRPYSQTTQYSAQIFEPSTATEIQQIINTFGIKRNKTIRAIGSAYSSAPLFTDDILISLTKFRDIKLRLVEDGYNENSVIIGAGWTVKEIEDLLYYHNYVILGFGSTQSQTFAGTLGTGAYGAFGAMDAYLISVWMIDGNGHDLYVNKYDNATLLAAIKVNIGLLGVIYKMEFEIHDTFNVEVNITNMNDAIFEEMSETDFTELMKMNRENTDYIGVKVLINPWNYILETFSKSTAEETVIDYKTDKQTQSFVNDIVLPLSCLLPECVEYMHWIKQKLELSDIESNVFTAKSVLNVFDVMQFGFIYAIPFEHCQSAILDVYILLKDNWPAFATVIPLLQNDNYGFLGYGYDRSVCMIEFYPNLCDSDRLYAVKEFEKKIVHKYGAVEHWATQYLFDGDNQDEYGLHAFYSKLNVFESIRKELDPYDIFMNEYIGKYFEMDEYKDTNITHEIIDDYNRNALEWTASSWYALFLCMMTTIVISICMIFGKYTSVLMPFAPKYFGVIMNLYMLCICTCIINSVVFC